MVADLERASRRTARRTSSRTKRSSRRWKSSGSSRTGARFRSSRGPGSRTTRAPRRPRRTPRTASSAGRRQHGEPPRADRPHTAALPDSRRRDDQRRLHGPARVHHIDVTIIRILFVLFALVTSGWGIARVRRPDVRRAARDDACAEARGTRPARWRRIAGRGTTGGRGTGTAGRGTGRAAVESAGRAAWQRPAPRMARAAEGAAAANGARAPGHAHGATDRRRRCSAR